MLAIKNGRAVLYDSILDGAVIIVDEGRIVNVGTEADVTIPEGCEVVDAEGCYISAGYVDIHVHGGGGSFFYEDPCATAEHFLSHGETTVLPTLYYDLSREEFIDSIKKIKKKMASGECPSIRGIYMEGPYMNPEHGASPDKNKWRGEIKREDYIDIIKEAKGVAKVWVVAPEREGVLDFVKDVKSIDPNAIISVGHSEANSEQVFTLKPYGLGLETHSMNATESVPSLKGTRNSGPDEACMLNDDMYAELISDSLAIHVHPDMQRLLLKVKGIDRVVLISDSFVSYEEPVPELRHVTDLSFDTRGLLSGSKLTLDVAVKNVMKHTGCTLPEAIRMATLIPARAVGISDEVGSLEAGKRADILLLDGELNVKRVMLGGEFKY